MLEPISYHKVCILILKNGFNRYSLWISFCALGKFCSLFFSNCEMMLFFVCLELVGFNSESTIAFSCSHHYTKFATESLNEPLFMCCKKFGEIGF